MEQKEYLEYTIGRFDHYYDSINNKGNVYLTINFFLFSGIVAAYVALLEKKVCSASVWELVTVALILVAIIFSSIFTIKAIKPYVSKATGNSTVFFADIAARDLMTWHVVMQNLQDSDRLSDLRVQSHILATGLTYKFKYLKKATFWLSVQLGLTGLAAILFIIKFYIQHAVQL